MKRVYIYFDFLSVRRIIERKVILALYLGLTCVSLARACFEWKHIILFYYYVFINKKKYRHLYFTVYLKIWMGYLTVLHLMVKKKLKYILHRKKKINTSHISCGRTYDNAISTIPLYFNFNCCTKYTTITCNFDNVVMTGLTFI